MSHSLEVVSFAYDTPEAILAAELAAKEIKLVDCHGQPTSEAMETYANVLRWGGVNYNIADESGELVATAFVEHGKDDDWEPYAEINAFAVRGDRRGKGLGRILLRHVAEQAIKRCDIIVRLTAESESFYMHFGFVEDEFNTSTQMHADPSDILRA